VVLIGAVSTIILGSFGACCTSNCCNKCWFAVIYGVTLFIMWVVFVAVGGVITGVSVVGPQQV